jgi:hypothetical protein
MTTTPDPQPAAQIQAPPESRLAQLQASYPDLKARAKAAAQALKDCTDAIKLELTTAAPGASRVDLAGGAHGPALQLTYSESWRVDATRLKAEQPVLYVQYAKKSGSWSLAEAKGGEA